MATQTIDIAADSGLTVGALLYTASDTSYATPITPRTDYTVCPLTADRYVSPSGNDNNDGLTPSTAWATLAPLNVWIAAQAAGTYSAIIKAGTYTVTEGLELTGNVAKTVTIEFEEGVTIDQSASGSRTYGIDADNTPLATWVVNLRGAQFLGVDTSSGNGIGTDGAPVLTVNGVALDGTRAAFSGFDDGISFHNTSGAVGDITINDVECFGCSKSAVVHVNASRGTHNRCRFVGTDGASVGIADDQSSVRSEFYDCEFIPSSSGAGGEKATVKHAVRCKFGNPAMVIDNNNVTDQAWDFTDCYVNFDQDGFGSGTWTRCYGKLYVRLRGDASTTMTMRNCAWDCDGADFCYANFDGGSDWLGGVLDVQDTIFQNVNQVFEHHSAAQIAHIEANWTADYCLFHNVTNIHESGLDFATNAVEADPLLGDADSAYQSDWVIGSGGGADGAGSSGGDIGFAADAIPTTTDEDTNEVALGRYQVAFSDLSAGRYLYQLMAGQTIKAQGFVDVLAVTGTYRDEGDVPTEGAGPYAYTVTVENDSSEALPNATVAAVAGGIEYRGTTDANGQVTLYLYPTAYTITASHPQATSGSSTPTISAAGSETLSLTAISTSTPASPYVNVLAYTYADGVATSGIEVSYTLLTHPANTGGTLHDGERREATSASGGLVTLTVVAGATYRVKGPSRTATVVIPSGATNGSLLPDSII